MGSWDLGAQWCAKTSSSQSGCLGIYRARICLIYKSVSLSLCTAVDCVCVSAARRRNQTIKGFAKRSNNQNPTNTTFPSHSFSESKQSKSRKIPGNRIRNRKHYSLVQGARCLRCPVCEKRLKRISTCYLYTILDNAETQTPQSLKNRDLRIYDVARRVRARLSLFRTRPWDALPCALVRLL